MRDRKLELDKAGVEVLVIDPHEVYRVRHMLASKAGAPLVTVLADPAGVVSATYGVAMQMKIHVERSNRPATFLIDRDGVLRRAWRGTTYSDRPDYDTIRGALTELGDAR